MSLPDLRCLLRREWPHIVLATRGTAAALAALSLAVVLQLECPFWAAMTALIVIQPTRGLLLEKSFYRLVGTAMGSTAGLLMLLSSRSPAMLTILLSLWLAGCVGTGNLLYGLRSYGAMVAGCTGAVIAMAGYSSPPHLNDLVFGRIACITIGIVVSTAGTLFFSHRHTKRELQGRLRAVAAETIEWVALFIRRADEKELVALRQALLVEIAAIEGAVDTAWAGSLDLKKSKRRVRGLIVSLLALIEAGKLAGGRLALQGSGHYWRDLLARQLEEVAGQLRDQGSTGAGAAGLEALLVETDAHVPLLGESLGELLKALQIVIAEWDGTAIGAGRTAGTFIRHRDWQEAGRAGLRAAVVIAAVGTVWHLTGWGEGPPMMMATSIMVSIFSTHDRPSVLLSHIFCGASIGVAAAFFCRLVLLPGVSHPLLQGVITIPVLMAGIIALSHRRTALGAMDFMLFFLFVMQPGLPAVPPAPTFVAGGIAVLGGVGAAILAFRFLLPVDPARRLRSLLIVIVRDLSSMTTAGSLPLLAKCRARTNHRVLRLLATAGKLDVEPGAVVEGGLAALAIARRLQQLRTAELKGDAPRADSGAIRKTKRRLSLAVHRPEKILPVLERVSVILCPVRAPHGGARTSSIRAVLPKAGWRVPQQPLTMAVPWCNWKSCGK